MYLPCSDQHFFLRKIKQNEKKKGETRNKEKRNIQILFGFYGTSRNAVRWRDQMASNRIKASSAKELWALPTSLALVSHVLSDVKQTYSNPDENPASPLPPFRVEQTPQLFRFESTQRAHSPKDPASSSSTTVFYDDISNAERSLPCH